MRQNSITLVILVVLVLLVWVVSERMVRATKDQGEYVTVVLKKSDARAMADKCSCCGVRVKAALHFALGDPSTPSQSDDEESISTRDRDYGDPRKPIGQGEKP